MTDMDRYDRQLEKRMRIEQDGSYRLCRTVAKLMDDYFVDPLLGFFLPGIGDAISQIMVLPYLYVSLFKVRSIPLTLAVICNMLIDSLIGMIPMLGDILDFFYKSNKKSYQLIVGFMEGDEYIKREVNSKAVTSAVLIAVLAILIYFMVKLVAAVMSWFLGLFD